MRARIAIRVAGLKVELREVVLKDKPEQMRVISPKATVPILQFTAHGKSQVLEQSQDIMLWALKQNDPLNWLGDDGENLSSALAWIAANDGDFKQCLDRYKYADRHPEQTAELYRTEAMDFINQLEAVLDHSPFILGKVMSLSDVAVFPFVRQFAHVDKNWFDRAVSEKLLGWLNYFLEHELFGSVMEKKPQWQAGDSPTYLWSET